jgi:hypothetical protein
LSDTHLVGSWKIIQAARLPRPHGTKQTHLP